MKIVIDAMAAEFGGIRTYVDQLVAAWQRSFPGDELHVMVPRGSSIAAAALNRHQIAVRRPAVAGRPWAQSRTMYRAIGELDADAVLATMPSTTFRRLRSPVAVVVHDLRHQLRPDQFSRARRVIRWVAYGRAYAVADGFVAVSARTRDDLHEMQPSTRGRPVVVVHHGADHVLEWPPPDRSGPAVAFAHHTNKNAQLMIDAWAVLSAQGSSDRLLIVGVGSDRRRLQAEIDERGLADCVSLAPFLPEDEFRRVVAAAAMIVFPSDFEGFGLPVVEGMALGKPVVIGPDRATIEVAGGHAAVMEDWTASALAAAVDQARRMTDIDLAEALAWGRSFTWERTAHETRAALAALSGR
ncbi:MAG TPA: glycosyltransferase [Nocardioidaceae bacterium]|nr:glycosyltransferase [Nocardioidaceae bacterium]